MRLKNVLIVVGDLDRSIDFYHDLFGLEVVLDNGGNVIMTEGLVLQEKKYWEEFLKNDILPRNNHSELYFEEKNIGDFVEKLERTYPDTEYVSRLTIDNRGRKMVLFYDPDGNLIEVGAPI